MSRSPGLLEAYGVEIEYMIVDMETLDVRPVADRLIHVGGKSRKNEITKGQFKWSNELVSHVVEIKTGRPVFTLRDLETGFQQQVTAVNQELDSLGCCLLPTGVHPWMNPALETVLWPYDDREIYDTFDRVFGCRGHGWSNLQSTHVNLSFQGDVEFRRLHSAIRLVLPLVPALAASSPYADGSATACVDYRLEAYGHNCERFPSISARLIPDVVASQADYESTVYARIHGDLVSVGAEDCLEPVWVNARGAIARFDRGSIEIRLLDTQECPAADLGILRFLVEMISVLVEQRHSSIEEQEGVPTELLADLLSEAIKRGGNAVIADSSYSRCFGIENQGALTLRELLCRYYGAQDEQNRIVEHILENGCLAERIRRRVGPEVTREKLQATYAKLAECLREGELLDDTGS